MIWPRATLRGAATPWLFHAPPEGMGQGEEQGAKEGTPSPPIKSLDFRGFDSSRLLILRGGNSHVR